MQTLGQEQLQNDEVLIILKSLGLLLPETAKSFDSERKVLHGTPKGKLQEC